MSDVSRDFEIYDFMVSVAHFRKIYEDRSGSHIIPKPLDHSHFQLGNVPSGRSS